MLPVLAAYVMEGRQPNQLHYLFDLGHGTLDVCVFKSFSLKKEERDSFPVYASRVSRVLGAEKFRQENNVPILSPNYMEEARAFIRSSFQDGLKMVGSLEHKYEIPVLFFGGSPLHKKFRDFAFAELTRLMNGQMRWSIANDQNSIRELTNQEEFLPNCPPTQLLVMAKRLMVAWGLSHKKEELSRLIPKECMQEINPADSKMRVREIVDIYQK